MLTFNNVYIGLIGWSFEMPNAPYLKREHLAEKNQRQHEPAIKNDKLK
jgi:hypothetical protein